MPSTLRVRLGIGSAVLLVVGLFAQWLSAQLTTGGMTTLGPDGFSESSLSTSYSTAAVLAGLGTFCIAAAVILVAGVVATLVVEERVARPAFIASDDVGDAEVRE